MSLPLHRALVTFLEHRAEEDSPADRSEAKDIEIILREVSNEIDSRIASKLIRLLHIRHPLKSSLLYRFKLALTARRSSGRD